MYFLVLFVLIILVVNIFLLDVFFWLYVCCRRGGPFWGDLLFVQIICHHLKTKLPIFKISVTDSFFLSASESHRVSDPLLHQDKKQRKKKMLTSRKIFISSHLLQIWVRFSYTKWRNSLVTDACRCKKHDLKIWIFEWNDLIRWSFVLRCSCRLFKAAIRFFFVFFWDWWWKGWCTFVLGAIGEVQHMTSLLRASRRRGWRTVE